MNFREPTQTNEQQAAGRGDAVSQVDTTEKLSEAEEPRTSLFALCWLASAAIYRWQRLDEIEVVRAI